MDLKERKGIKYLKLAEDKYIGWYYDRAMPATFIMNKDKMREALVQSDTKEPDVVLAFMDLEPNIFLQEILMTNKAGHHHTCLDLEGLIKYYTDPRDDE